MLTNSLLIRSAGGWTEDNDGGSVATFGRCEGLLGLGAQSSADEVDRITQATLNEFAQPRVQIDLLIDPRTPTEDAYTGWNKGDTITAPDEAGVPGETRILGITVTEDDQGEAYAVPMLTSIVMPEDARIRQSVKKMDPGALGGMSAAAQPVASSRGTAKGGVSSAGNAGGGGGSSGDGRVRLRTDTHANWAANNTTLIDGEPGYDTTYKLVKVGDGSQAWNDLAYLDHERLVVKLADESVSSSTALQNDDELAFTTVSGELYLVEFTILYHSAASVGGDLKVAVGEDSTARGVIEGLGFSVASAAMHDTAVCDQTDTISFGAATTDRMAIMRGWVRGNGGTLRLKWAQDSSDSDATTVLAGSQMRVRLRS